MKKLFFVCLVVLAFGGNASVAPFSKQLDVKFKKDYEKKEGLVKLKEETLRLGGKAIPTLINVMKSDKYPDKNRWVATFLLGRIAGEKSVPFISKFTKHPHWLMRMASLKTLLALKQDKFGEEYAKLLQDDSLLVRIQAIENIRRLGLQKYSAHIWSMLYDQRNYYQVKKVNKRTNIVKTIIKAVGDLKFDRAKMPLLKMIRDKKYKDIFPEMDYALAKIVGKKSPSNSREDKMRFWNKIYIENQVI